MNLLQPLCAVAALDAEYLAVAMRLRWHRVAIAWRALVSLARVRLMIPAGWFL